MPERGSKGAALRLEFELREANFMKKRGPRPIPLTQDQVNGTHPFKKSGLLPGKGAFRLPSDKRLHFGGQKWRILINLATGGVKFIAVQTSFGTAHTGGGCGVVRSEGGTRDRCGLILLGDCRQLVRL